MANCLICSKDCTENQAHIIKLTAQEREFLLKSGSKPLEQYTYCKPCWRILSDPATAPDFISGLVHLNLRKIGVSNAKDLAERYKHWLAKHAVRKS